MSEPVYLTTLAILFGTIFMIFLIRSQTIIKKAQLQADGEESYRLIAERAVAAQEETAAALADLKTRIIAIEKVLKEVE
ncbi:hypothetical protein KW842_04690 [Duganella sp. sic0402]|uniref:hypothetical protein n=1 Tax=Duganella sp. sic0402 TaxID=2854786 RepID=UPI001C43BC1E|nr:hypothetical protein [Duganella sp. sic0402]MBV7535064.1 hypothetical protein [Duganella sp. sic0402]